MKTALQQLEVDYIVRTGAKSKEGGGWPRTADSGIRDAFEPNLLEVSLRRANYNLGHLIFGDAHWAKICQQAGQPPLTLSTADDPLSTYFQKGE